MRFAIIYGTTEGQTRKVCRFIQNTLLEDGHASELLQATDSESTDLTHVDAVIAAGSVHAGFYQKDLTAFVTTHANAMGYLPNLFVSVSLTAANDDAENPGRNGQTHERGDRLAAGEGDPRGGGVQVFGV